ncbi:hypothetical protein DPQ25_08170 [Hydrogeniiclostridium mannosilyticum]|uniref:Uncharacterized protein n=1 Tax=Hydrogeniiclostridium mannosilyticum TaxID=2764322 RepID=A0A328UBK5_9FIRM|nr:hypothetical protein DPQ25_08170 [Hydrogeniiclostridium mannosilyticum]
MSFSHPPYCGPLPLISEKNFRFGAARQGHARKGNSNCSKAGLFFIIIILCIRKKSQMFTVKNWTGGKNTPFRPRGAQPFNAPPEAAAPKNKQEGRCPRGGASSCLYL